jgi:poly-gamma-glutamate biosynthesis protein PgsC/CapC
MDSLLSISVGIGLATGLMFSELFGLAAGGLIVPGYIAIELNRPGTVALTLLAGWLTYAVIRALSTVMILYGRRRTALTILLGYLLGFAARWATTQIGGDASHLDVIGFIIPGLIAIWMARQGVVATVASVLIVSVMVRLLLIVAVGDLMNPVLP